MQGSNAHRDGLWARAANLLASGWLIVSAFAWERGAPRTNAAVVGYLVFVMTVLATTLDDLRAVNSVLGLWLLVAAWILPGAAFVLRCNTAFLGLVVFGLSLVSSRGGLRPPLVERFQPHAPER